MQSLALRSGAALDLLQERTWGSLWLCSINYMNSLLQLLGSSCLAPVPAHAAKPDVLGFDTNLAQPSNKPLPYCHYGTTAVLSWWKGSSEWLGGSVQGQRGSSRPAAGTRLLRRSLLFSASPIHSSVSRGLWHTESRPCLDNLYVKHDNPFVLIFSSIFRIILPKATAGYTKTEVSDEGKPAWQGAPGQQDRTRSETLARSQQNDLLTETLTTVYNLPAFL